MGVSATQPEWWQVLIAAGGVLSSFAAAYAGIKRRVDRNLEAARTEHEQAETMHVRASVVNEELERVAAQLQMAWDRNERLASAVSECERELTRNRDEARLRDTLLMVHAAWDHNVLHVLRDTVTRLRAEGVPVDVDDEDMQPPPPLRPPVPRPDPERDGQE